MIPFVLLIASSSANLELACIRLPAPVCEAVATKLRLYSRGNAVTTVAAEETVAADNTVFRITLRAEADTCALEVIALLSNASTRITRFGCSADNPRNIALHIESELQSDFEGALAALATQPRRTRVAKSTLLPQPASAEVAPASIAVLPEPAPEPPPAPAPQPAWQFSLAAYGNLSGVGDVVFGGAALGFGAHAPIGLGGEVGLRADFRPPLPGPRGPIDLTFVSPYLRLHWRFSLHPNLQLDVALHGEVPIGLVRLDRAFQRVFATAALGPALRVRFPMINGHLALVVDVRTVAAFNQIVLVSGGQLQRSMAPILWSAGAGVELLF